MTSQKHVIGVKLKEIKDKYVKYDKKPKLNERKQTNMKKINKPRL